MTLPDAGHWNVPEPPPHILEEHLDRCDPPEGEAQAPGPAWAEAPAAPAQQGGLSLLWALHRHATKDDWLWDDVWQDSSTDDALWPYK